MAYLNEGLDGAELLPAKGVSHVSGAGTFTSYPSGGGGWGNPHKRPAETVAMDAKNGYISLKSAFEVYGVALNEDFTVDEAKTKALRG
jgi:N-methylhydantoinase B/oxoprolinase/acetone carboxylase alpha subunit